MDETEAVRWAITAFCSAPEAEDGELISVLRSAGVPAEMAQRACLMLPLAFGRRLLVGARLATVYREVDSQGHVVCEASLADDAFFSAAKLISETEATRAQMQAIGLRSAEVHAANNALHAGAKLEDAEFSPPLLFFGEPPASARPPVPAQKGNGTDATAMLAALIEAHGIAVRRDGAVLLLPGGQTFRARVFPSELTHQAARLQLDFVISAPQLGSRTIVESFSGLGESIRSALSEAIGKFARGSIHALLAVLVDGSLGGDQVEWETWGDPPNAFRICLGPLLRQWSNEPPIDFGAFVDETKALLLTEKCSRDIHWVRTFVGCADGKLLGFDSLLDNDTWPAGVRCVEAWKWPYWQKPYALRAFFLMVPEPLPS